MKLLYNALSFTGGITAFQAALDGIDNNPWLIVPITIAIILIVFWLRRDKKKPKRNNFGSGLGRIKA